MEILCTYTNINSESFQLAYAVANTPPEANYWGFLITATHPVWNKYTFKAFVEKSVAGSLGDAIEFLKNDPVAYVKHRLDEVEGKRLTLIFRPLVNGWAVI